MSIFQINDKNIIESLFQGWQETMIWSCLQGYMGKAYVDDIIAPKSAQIVIADFTFFAGEANRELVCNALVNYKNNFTIMVPQNNNWSNLIEEVYGEKAKKVCRYATKKEEDAFQIDKLNKIVESLESSFKIQPINKEIFNAIGKLNWAADLCSQFSSYEEYEKLGVGFVITKDKEIVSGASSYTRYANGIEIEIDTREDFRRRGLALVAGARLILECINNNLYPSWDAQNKESLMLAEKLGYHFDKEYDAYEVMVNNNEIKALVKDLFSKDNKIGCKALSLLEIESEKTNRVYEYFDDLVSMINNKNSYIRNRGILLIGDNAKWDKYNKIEGIIEEYLKHILDEKPITSRQCIKSLLKIGKCKPDLVENIKKALKEADTSGYKDSMRNLIDKDIVRVLEEL